MFYSFSFNSAEVWDILQVIQNRITTIARLRKMYSDRTNKSIWAVYQTEAQRLAALYRKLSKKYFGRDKTVKQVF